MFPRIYDNATCPLAGYEGYTFRVLLNPTGAEKEDWFLGNLGAAGCAACAALRAAQQGAAQERVYCPDCQASRERMGRAAVALFSKSQVASFDFSTPDLALASLECEHLPDELLAWLFMLPNALWSARTEEIKKKLSGASPTTS